MTVDNARGRAPHRAVSSTAPERRAEALVAAYIHELSSRHDAGRESRDGGMQLASRPQRAVR